MKIHKKTAGKKRHGKKIIFTAAMSKKIIFSILILTALFVTGAGTLIASGATTAATAARAGSTAEKSDTTQKQKPSGQPLTEGLPADLVPDAESHYTFPESYYIYRTFLTEAEQAAYAQAYGNALEICRQFPLHTPISPQSLDKVMRALFFDHPALFWLLPAYQYHYDSNGLAVSVTLYYNDTMQNITAAKAAFERETQAVLTAARALGSDVEKEKYVYDHLQDTVVYVSESGTAQSAYGALVGGESACAGYARAFQYLMQQLDIPCYYVAGHTDTAHAWNIIRLDDAYYNVDVTWDDPQNNENNERSYHYFNLTDLKIAVNHTRSEFSRLLPVCNSTAYSYTRSFGFLSNFTAGNGQSAPATESAVVSEAPPAQGQAAADTAHAGDAAQHGSAASGEEAAGDTPAAENSETPPAESEAAPTAEIGGNEMAPGGENLPDEEILPLPTPEDAGFVRDEALCSLQAYYDYCEEMLVALGTGDHTFTLLICTQELAEEILSASNEESVRENYLADAAARLALNGYSAVISLQSEALSDGYYLLTQQVQLTEPQPEAAEVPQAASSLPAETHGSMPGATEALRP